MNTKFNALTEAVYYILLSLKSPLHGYGIIQNVKEMTNERITLGAGTLYGALNTMLEKKWIEPYNQSKLNRKKEYLITETGREVLEAEIERLQELLENGRKILNIG